MSMPILNPDNAHHYKIDLVPPSKILNKWVPEFLRPSHYWKLLSGNWKSNSQNHITFSCDPSYKTGENIAIAGNSSWNDYRLDLQFRFTTASSTPPEGGIIIYFYLRNLKNFYSFHYCLFKNQIEFIKRYRGIWSSGVKEEFFFKLNKDYKVRIISRYGFHRCQIDDTIIEVNNEMDISNGCIGVGVKYCNAIFQVISVSLP